MKFGDTGEFDSSLRAFNRPDGLSIFTSNVIISAKHTYVMNHIGTLTLLGSIQINIHIARSIPTIGYKKFKHERIQRLN